MWRHFRPLRLPTGQVWPILRLTGRMLNSRFVLAVSNADRRQHEKRAAPHAQQFCSLSMDPWVFFIRQETAGGSSLVKSRSDRGRYRSDCTGAVPDRGAEAGHSLSQRGSLPASRTGAPVARVFPLSESYRLTVSLSRRARGRCLLEGVADTNDRRHGHSTLRRPGGRPRGVYLRPPLRPRFQLPDQFQNAAAPFIAFWLSRSHFTTKSPSRYPWT